MKKLLFFSALIFAGFSCSDDDSEIITIDPTVPTGTFTVQQSGSFVEQNGTGSMGTVEVGTDSDGEQFLRFGSNFNTNLATGTVTVYFSTSMEFVPNPGAGNPDLQIVGPVGQSGENFFLVEPDLDSKFTHVILWCGSANIPFGYAELN
jgi:hypothetical protein